MKAVASRVTEKSDVLLLTAVDMEDSGPYEIAEPRLITALETYTPSCMLLFDDASHCALLIYLPGLQTPKLKRLAEIVSAQAIQQIEKVEYGHTNGNGHPESQGLPAIDDVEGNGM